jgi:cardiolipin synthase
VYLSSSFSRQPRGEGPNTTVAGHPNPHRRTGGARISRNSSTPEQPEGRSAAAEEIFPDLKAAGPELVRAIGSNGDDSFSAMPSRLVSAINNAEASIDMTVAYFIPDPQLLEAITGAAQRGVAVTRSRRARAISGPCSMPAGRATKRCCRPV